MSEGFRRDVNERCTDAVNQVMDLPLENNKLPEVKELRKTIKAIPSYDSTVASTREMVKQMFVVADELDDALSVTQNRCTSSLHANAIMEVALDDIYQPQKKAALEEI